MVLNRYIYRIIRYALFIGIFAVFSCEEYPLVTNCEECLFDDPLNTNLTVKVDKSAVVYSNVVRIRLYLGNLEDDVLLDEFMITSNEYEIPVSLNRKYTVTATYAGSNGNSYTAVDSATPRVRYEPNICEDPCYWVYDKVLNLKLKYY